MVILSGKAQENYSVSVYEGFHRIFGVVVVVVLHKNQVVVVVVVVVLS